MHLKKYLTQWTQRVARCSCRHQPRHVRPPCPAPTLGIRPPPPSRTAPPPQLTRSPCLKLDHCLGRVAELFEVGEAGVLDHARGPAHGRDGAGAGGVQVLPDHVLGDVALAVLPALAHVPAGSRMKSDDKRVNRQGKVDWSECLYNGQQHTFSVEKPTGKCRQAKLPRARSTGQNLKKTVNRELTRRSQQTRDSENGFCSQCWFPILSAPHLSQV